MRIERAHIQNYRSIHDETVDFDELTAFVGPNGCGKSSVLRAIQIFYESRTQVSPDDHYNRDEATPIRIALTFTDLGLAEKALFAPYIQQDKLTVTKVFERGGEKYFGTSLRHRGFSEVRAIAGKPDRRAAYGNLKANAPYLDLPNVRGAEAAEAEMVKWEQAHRDLCEMLPDDGQFFGFRQVGQSRLERFTRYIFVPAVREAGQDAADSRGSAIYDLMELVVRSALSKSEAFVRFKEKTQTNYRELINPANLTQLNQLSTRLTQNLRYYVPSASVLLAWVTAEDMKIPLPNAIVRLREDRFEAPVDKVGHGLQRAFILSLLQSLVGAQSDAGSPEQVHDAAAPPEPSAPDLILGIEEPELYQHPNRQRHLSRVLLQFSKGSIPGVAKKTQVLYCTHSPLFVDLARFDSVRRLTKRDHPGSDTLPRVTFANSMTLGNLAQRLEAAQDAVPQQPFTGEAVSARMSALMTPWLNEGFFGDVVVLVEGEDDRCAILGAAKMLGHDFEASGIAVLICGGKSNLDRPYLVFTGLGIPTYVVFDGDKTKNEGDKANRCLQRLMGVQTPVAFPATQVNKTWAIFEENLNDLIENAAGEELLSTVSTKFMQEFGYPDRATCRKSPSFVATLLQQAKAQGKQVAEIEQIIAAIVALLPRTDTVVGADVHPALVGEVN